DGNITASIIIGGLPIDTNTPGSHIVTYDVTDSSGNAAIQVTRTVNVTDTEIPEITLSGSTPVNVEVGTAYNDAGATASDNVDGNITASIITTGLPIDTSTPDSYIVTYDVTDSSGNAAVQVARTVNVTDTEIPVITLSGSTPVNVEVGAAYNDAGATASDNVDGDITASIITNGLPIDTSTPGSYIVTYDVTDSSGNVAIQVTRTVNVADSAIPVITLSGSTPVNVEVGAAYNDAGATANDNVDGNISANIVTTGLPIDTSTPGSYIVTYDVTDSSGNAAVQVTRTVNVTDTEVPVITLSGSTPVNVEVGSAYNDAGATASDNVDGNISVNIVTGGLPIDTSTPGSYIVTYDVIDSSGNAAVQVTRTVNVTDTTIPVITLSGSTPVNVEVGTAYNDEGATASDNVDGNITASIVTGGLPIDTSVLGNHTVTYDVTDSSGNAAVQVTRTVNVIDTSSPVAISSVDFEAGWDIWNDGGSDARRSSKDAAYANSGSYCIRLRDNSSTSVMTTDNLDLSTYSEIEVQFSYYCRSMDKTSEDFWLQISTDGGSNFITVEEWNRDDEFVNNERHNETVVISGISLSSNTKLRFRCDASGNQDWVYMDDVIISTR
ncbi:MAG: DUF5011 domain-containing protein, partial [Gammaproteobacteria bacterium]|nr:DUF5011 domain-containing protein [Gammaproteobacteria bacterium]